MWDAVGHDGHHPKHSQYCNEDQKLRRISICKIIITQNAEIGPLHDRCPTFETILPCNQRGELQILEDVMVDSDSHEEHEQVHDSDNYSNDHEGNGCISCG